MKKTNTYLTSGVLVAMLMCGSATALAAELPRSEQMYNFLPGDVVVQNVKTSLQNHGIDASSLQVNADAKGVVTLSGLVDSKQDAETATHIAKETEGVYAVLGEWRYESAAIPVSEAQTLIEGEPTASGNEGSQSDMQ